MIVAVLDTNVLASGLTHAKGSSGQVMLAWRRRAFTLVVSEHLLDELSRTLEDRYFKKHLTARQRSGLIPRLRRQAWFTDLTAQVRGVAPSPEDDQVLATAKSADAAYVVTGDEKFLAVGAYEGIQLVSPRQFVTLLAHAGEEDR